MSTPTKPKPKGKHISIRVDDDILTRLDKIAAWLVQRSPGLTARRSFGVRAALLRGMDVLEAEMAYTKRGKR